MYSSCFGVDYNSQSCRAGCNYYFLICWQGNKILEMLNTSLIILKENSAPLQCQEREPMAMVAGYQDSEWWTSFKRILPEGNSWDSTIAQTAMCSETWDPEDGGCKEEEMKLVFWEVEMDPGESDLRFIRKTLGRNGNKKSEKFVVFRNF